MITVGLEWPYYLLDLSNEFQMIYFTCHDREEKILKAEGIEIKVKDIDEI